MRWGKYFRSKSTSSYAVRISGFLDSRKYDKIQTTITAVITTYSVLIILIVCIILVSSICSNLHIDYVILFKLFNLCLPQFPHSQKNNNHILIL